VERVSWGNFFFQVGGISMSKNYSLYTGFEEIPREDFSSAVEGDLENLENNAGFQFNNWGQMEDYGDGPHFLVNGKDMEGWEIMYERESSGGKYLWSGDKKRYKLSEVLFSLKGQFNERIWYVKHMGDALEKLGINTKGLGFKDSVNMKKMLYDMGVDTPSEPLIPKGGEFTREEKKALHKEWKSWWEKEIS